MKRRIVLLIIAIGFLSFFTVISFWIQHGAFRTVDFAFTVKLQEAIDTSPRLRLSRFVGEVMEGSTFFASPEVSVIGVLGLTGLAFYDWKKKKVRWIVLIIPALFFFLVLAEVYGKTVVHHPAPPFFMIKNPTTIFPKYYINEQFSYPSGHTARATFIAMIFSFLVLRTSYLPAGMAYFKRKRIWIGGLILLLVYVGLVSISRIYLGHHWLSDVVGGGFLGIGFGLFTSSVLYF